MAPQAMVFDAGAVRGVQRLKGFGFRVQGSEFRVRG
jgi:hypothetical protein